MSRNLCAQVCVHCEHAVVLDEPARPITKEDCWRYIDEFRGTLVARAHCPMCEAKYLAWMDDTEHTCRYGRGMVSPRVSRDGIPIDLSYLSTFDDEPGPEDLPRYRVERVTTWVRKGLYGKP